MKQRIFLAFRKITKFFSGHGLRDRIKLIDQLYKKINRELTPSVAEANGHMMFLDRDDSMELAINGTYEPAETKLVSKLIQPGSIVLDIGANIGYFTLLFAKLVGPRGHVFAFEPDPYSFDLLLKNINVNNYSNVTAFQFAVSDHDSELQLFRDRFNNLDHRTVSQAKGEEVVVVKGVRLDDFLPTVLDREIDFIKMDIQGSEGWALEGMKNLVRQSNSIQILTEYWPTGLDQARYGSDKYLRQLSNMGFELIDVGEEINGFVSVTVEELASRYPKNLLGHTNLLCRRPK
jgi:FkbM family methyltransferase